MRAMSRATLGFSAIQTIISASLSCKGSKKLGKTAQNKKNEKKMRKNYKEPRLFRNFVERKKLQIHLSLLAQRYYEGRTIYPMLR
jgi:hypothetical protein